jgi:8-oxo-dGTP pyrophosphatase MutT (NUDIX family)
MSRFLPLQVAAVCYRRRGTSFEFLLVKTTSGDRWTFPKGAIGRRLSHAQAAEREALEEAGAVGVIESQHFHLYLHPSQRDAAREFVVKAFLLEVDHTQPPQEPGRNPTWFAVDDACKALARERDVRYAAELHTLINRAVDHLSAGGSIVQDYPARIHRLWGSLLRVFGLGLVR